MGEIRNVSASVQTPVAGKTSDPLLTAYLQARDGREADRALDKLLTEQARPLIRSIVGRKWRSSIAGVDRAHQAQSDLDIEDLQSEALSQLITRLAEAKQVLLFVFFFVFCAFVVVFSF